MYEKEVRAGIGLLDRVFTGENWRPYIDRQELDLASVTRCMLGQLAVMMAPPERKQQLIDWPLSRYAYAVQLIKEWEDPEYDTDSYTCWMDAYGFETNDAVGNYGPLKDTWLRLMDETDPDKKENHDHA